MQRQPDVSLDRRTLLSRTLCSLAGAALGPWTPKTFAAGGLVTIPVSDELSVIGGAGGNIAVLATSDGQVVIDSGAALFSDAVVTTLSELPGDGVTALFNTHWHLDQVGGNEVLGKSGATIFAHDKTRQRLASGYYVPGEERYEHGLPSAALPTETFFTDGATTVGGRRIEYGYLIEAHTDGDCYVYFPDTNVFAVGDVLSPVRDPAFDWFGGGWLGGRVDALAMLLDMSDADARFIPSYGPVVGRAALESEHAMLLDFFERMVEHVRLGETAEDMLTLGILDGLGREFSDPYRLLYDTHKGFWAHHNTLMHDIV